MSGWINVNGKFLASGIAVFTADSRAFRYGDGLFETIKVVEGILELKELHFKRLYSGMEILQIKLPTIFNAGFLEQQVLKTIAKNKITTPARVRLAVFRGEGGLYEPDGKGAGYLIQVWTLDKTGALNENGLIIGAYYGASKNCDLLSGIKSNNYLVYVMAALFAKNNRWNDCLVINNHGRVCDATIANLFWIKNARLYTVPLTEGGVAGVMRQHLIDSLPAKGWEVIEKPVTLGELEEADELFLTNSMSGIRWVNLLNNHHFTNNLTREIWRATF